MFDASAPSVILGQLMVPLKFDSIWMSRDGVKWKIVLVSTVPIVGNQCVNYGITRGYGESVQHSVANGSPKLELQLLISSCTRLSAKLSLFSLQSQ